MPNIYDLDDREYMDDDFARSARSNASFMGRRKTKRSAKKTGVRGKRRARKSTSKSHSSRKSRGKVYYAKGTGQPYILLKSGKAKFIKGKRHKR